LSALERAVEAAIYGEGRKRQRKPARRRPA
jgi:hypothetical protein